MQPHEVKALLKLPPYAFLREEENLRQVIYLTVSGSLAYGTNKAGSDIDLRGVLLETPRYLYGLERFEQFEDRATDTVIYGLKKFIGLCAHANPNALELLGTNADCIVLMTPEGKLLRDNADLFLSRRVIQSFGNYASAQLRRLTNALCHDNYASDDQEAYLARVLDGQVEHFNSTYAAFGEDNMRVHVSEEDPLQLLLDMELHGYPLRDFGAIYREMHTMIKTFGHLNHRNRKKDEMHLYKHAMHLIRLLITGADILSGKCIITHRSAEHAMLMDIRNGVHTFDEVITMAQAYQRHFEDAAKHTTLPEKPDMDRIEALMRKLYGVAL